MKRITLKSISLRNFKGAKEIDISFIKDNTNICGDNATFKTTVFDGWSWLLFGKDSTDRQDFGIIPLSSNNQPLEKVDNEVSAVLDEDGSEITLRRVHHQKWVKPRGSAETVYNGNETLFYYNGVPQKAGEYKTKIEAIMDEGIFKLVTNPLYFNSILWKDRRTVLTSMAGEIMMEDVETRLNGQFKELLEVLHKGKPAEEYRKEISARKKKIKEDLDGIPTRIDEINRFIPEKVDEKAIQKQIDQKQGAIDEIDQQIADANRQTDKEAEDYRSLRESLNGLKDRKDDMYQARKKELNARVYAEDDTISNINHEIERLGREIDPKQREKEFEEKGLKADQNSMTTLRENWAKINAEELKFDEGEFKCPTCLRLYEVKDIEAKKEQMTRVFRQNKTDRMERITLLGTELKGRVEQAQKKIKEIGDQITELKTKKTEEETALSNRPKIDIPDVNKDLDGNLDYQDILKSITELEEKVNHQPGAPDISSHQEMKRTINAVLDDLKKQLTINESRQKSFNRIAELETQEKDLAQQMADLEKTEFSIQEFIKARTDLIESRINDKFSMVRFKMFKQNINGSEEEACETLIDGVPFSDANNGAKINAGLDIINALSSHYGITAPIFIDNKESVNELIHCESQLINLVVTKDKSLTLT